MAKKAKPVKEKTKLKIADDEPKKGKKRDLELADDEPKGKKSKKDKLKASSSFSGFDPSSLYTDSIDEISRRQGVDSDLMDNLKPTSTGCLALDLLENGGLRPGLYIHAGWEQTCKTTGCFQIMASAVKQKVPLIALWDFEGSSATSKPYIASIMRTMGLKVTVRDLFGKKDKETGKWIQKPLVRYTASTVGEKFFDWLSEILRTLPDKKYVADKWWFVFDDTKVNKAKYGQYANDSMPKKYGKGIWVEAQDGNPQAVIIIDSFAAMNPAANDDEEQNKSLGLQARMFAANLPRIKGRLAQKLVTVVGTNQLRDIPMAMYGPKEQEAAGKALRYNSDVRVWWNSRTSGMPFNPKFNDERLEVERTWEDDGKDMYRYIQIVSKKNKLGGGAGRKTWIRLWVSDKNGDARGFDPVFDTIHFLKETGQLSGKRKKFVLDLHGIGKAKKPIDWSGLKMWILGDKDDKIKISKALGFKPMDLRKFCFNQVGTGKADELWALARNNGKDVEEDE
ncbi:hypothetical protein [Burkholderia phage BCSR5]|nr:hypothetical protein [Burkholderia phage BCSR5]